MKQTTLSVWRLCVRVVLTLVGAVGSVAAADERGEWVLSPVDYRQGLSSSAVICIFKDPSGLVWLGTYDGLDCYDGRGMEVFRTETLETSDSRTLDNNVIYGIAAAGGDNLWVQTLLGVNRFSKDKKRVVANFTVAPGSRLCSNARGDTWLLSADSISYYNTRRGCFVAVERPAAAIAPALVAADGTLWLFGGEGKASGVRHLVLDGFDGVARQVRLSVSSSQFHHLPVESLYHEGGSSFCFVDSERVLYMYDLVQQTKVRIRDIGPLVDKYGSITDVVPFYDDFIIAFRTNGLVRLRTALSYREEEIDRNLRVFDLCKDPVQGILWVGVDGKGAMTYARRYSIATNLMTRSLSPAFTRQVRSILTDSHGGLWFGTKGDGLVHVPSYASGADPARTVSYFPDSRHAAGAYKREDTEFPVYALSPSRYGNGFWVGSTERGLYWFDYGEESLHRLVDPAAEQPYEVHEIHQTADTTLWIATAGSGFRRLTVERSGRAMVVKKSVQYRFFDGGREISTFFSIVPQDDSILWLGSRERGLVRFDVRTGEYKVLSLKEMTGRKVDDVLALHISRGGDLFVGTTAGLVRVSVEGDRVQAVYRGREHGFLNDMIHGILEDDASLLWLSTNRGVVKYDPAGDSFHTYYYSGGVQIGEFSDDAYWRCPYTGRLFFGGIDGLLWMNGDASECLEYWPDILLRSLAIGGREVPLDDHRGGAGGGLRFRYTEDEIALKIAAPDFIAGADIEYSWMLEGYDGGWSAFAATGEASWRGVPPGRYLFRARYRKDIFDTDRREFSIPVRIVPRWYQTAFSMVVFILLCAAAVAGLAIAIFRMLRNKRLVAKLLESERRNVSQNLARDAERLNHRSADTLTSIYLACEGLMDGGAAPGETESAARLIRENVISLLFPAGIFRHTRPGIFEPVQFSVKGSMRLKALSDETLSLMEGWGFGSGAIRVEIPDEVVFPVWTGAMRSLLCYIYTFAPGAGRSHGFTVAASVDEGSMTLRVSSLKKGILRKIHRGLSDETHTPTAVPSNPDTALWMNLLHGLAVAAVKQTAPQISLRDGDGSSELSFVFAPAPPSVASSVVKKSVLVLEERVEMFSIVEGLLSSEWTVCQVASIQQALEVIRRTPPAALVVDMAMYADAEEPFVEYMRCHSSLMAHTALVAMFTPGTAHSMRREVIVASDGRVMLPYDVPYLNDIVHKAVYGRAEAKHIPVEGLDDFAGFITCTTRQQADFVRRLLAVIADNIDRDELSSSFIAERMAMSARGLYRKFREVSHLPPTELIKNYRMVRAAELLRAGDLSIREIIMDVGISSRSYFYKEFALKFGMTPKDYRLMHCADPEDACAANDRRESGLAS